MKYAAIERWLAAHTEFAPEFLGGHDVEHFVDNRVRDLGGANETAYLRVLQTDEDELGRLLAEVAVPETSFFRYGDSYEMLSRWLRRRRETTRGAAAMRMLSVACATGEEPCSMAIAAAHAGWRPANVRIDAVDRSAVAIERARRGGYQATAIEAGVPTWARSSFVSNGREVRLDPRLRSVIHYQRENVLERPVSSSNPYDVIFCRNLLIYLAPSARRRLVAWLRQSLSADGVLFLGHAERGTYLEGVFTAINERRSYAYTPAPASGSRRSPAPAAHVRAEAAGRVRAVRTAPPSRPIVVAGRRPASRELPREGAPPPTLDEARALADRGQLRPALDMARTVLESDGPAPEVLELIGSVHLALGDTQRAHDSFFRAVYLEPARAASLLQLALIAEHRGDAAEAFRYRQRAARAPRTS